MKKQTKKPLSPEAAKVLEQYRNAGKAPAEGGGAGTGSIDDGAGSGQRPTGPAPNPVRQRSGTRGK